MDQPTNKPAPNDLAALADGELTPEHQKQVADLLVHHPEAARQVAFQLQLRDAVAKSQCDQAPQPSADLRRSIQAMLAAPAPLPMPRSVPAQPARAMRFPGWFAPRWVPAAVAAMLLIGAFLTLYSNTNNPAVANGTMLTQDQANTFTSKHSRCALDIERLHNAEKFPTKIDQMPQAIADYLGKNSYPALDLSSAGFDYQAAGTCNAVKDAKSVHMIYKNAQNTGCHDSLSIWVAVYNGKPGNINPDQVYEGNDPERAHPIVYWRHGDLLYYLVGDSYDHVHAAAETLAKGK